MARNGSPPRGGCRDCLRSWGCGYLVELGVCLALFFVGAGLELVQPRPQPFFERNPALSFPYIYPATVPPWLLFVICALVPIVVIVPATLLRVMLLEGGSAKTAGRLLAWLLLALAQALALTVLITNSIKNAAGRPRPNFFAYADYKGGRAALASGNATGTAYWADTTPGVLGSLAYAQAPANNVMDAQRSFPSGHSSLTFAGMLFLVFFCRWGVGVARGEWLSLRAVLCGAPLAIAGWVALSRTWDFYHNYSDIVTGAAIGIMCACLAWRHFQAHGAERDPFFSLTSPAVAPAGLAGAVAGGYGTIDAVLTAKDRAKAAAAAAGLFRDEEGELVAPEGGIPVALAEGPLQVAASRASGRWLPAGLPGEVDTGTLSAPDVALGVAVAGSPTASAAGASAAGGSTAAGDVVAPMASPTADERTVLSPLRGLGSGGRG